jgi:hypothetical protein
MLSDDDRRRIEDEERKRVDEESYRAEVRSRLHDGDGPKPAASHDRLGLIIGIGIVLIVAVWFTVNDGPGSRRQQDDARKGIARAAFETARPVPKIRYVPVSQKIATGQVTVKAGAVVYYKIRIEPEMHQPVVAGSFNASGGSGNDISAVIADESEYTNWINGHEAQVYWSTKGRKTTGRFEVRLPPGTYYLAISNKFSVLTAKYVFLEAELNYKRQETYY